jgi:ABC-2 type transport system permease protein
MSYPAFTALMKRDLRLFFMDKRAVTMSFAAPILIASFFGYIFGGVTKDNKPSKISIAIVNQDSSPLAAQVVAGLKDDPALDTKQLDLVAAREQVRTGKIAVAAVLDDDFVPRAGRAMAFNGTKPDLLMLYDPSHATEMQVVRGAMMQHVMEVIGRRLMTGFAGRGGAAGGNAPAAPAFTMPFTIKPEAVTAHKGEEYNSMAHSFVGMTVQFILFMGIDAGMTVIYQRRSGLWKRLRAAPLSRWVVIGSRAASSTIVATLIMLTVFAFARVVFGVKIEGSMMGFLGLSVAFALLTAAFGLLIAVFGKTPEGTRGISILATLMMVMLGGSWVPSFVFPQWLQQVTLFVPTRWAVDGLDAMVWRGSGFSAALEPIGVLCGFALLFGVLAVWRFRWEAEG